MVFFVLKHPATTTLYPYCHTLSLHYALPIFLIGGEQRGEALVLAGTGDFLDARGVARGRAHAELAFLERCGVRARGGQRAGGQFRSEEQTSELQSLMRISYAVFCLKKKKYKHITQ